MLVRSWVTAAGLLAAQMGGCASGAGCGGDASPVDADRRGDGRASDGGAGEAGHDGGAGSDSSADAGGLAAACTGLVIHPDNPYFLFSNGRFVISWASNGQEVDPAVLSAQGFSHYELEHRWFDGRAPALSGNRFPESGNLDAGGFDGGYFAGLRSALDDARAHGISVSLILFSLTAFETDRTPGSRFGQNPWNACLGGPIDTGSCPFQEAGERATGATVEFLTLFDSEDYVEGNALLVERQSYDDCSTVSCRVQYRTEEIVRRFVEELRELRNWAFNMAWEINDNPGEALTRRWVNWFAGLVHRLDAERLVFTGEEDAADYASESNVDGSEHEGTLVYGGAYDNLRRLGAVANRKPKVIIGYDPFDAAGAPVDKLCIDNPENISGEQNILWIREALLTPHGVHPGTPFHFARCAATAGGQRIVDYVGVLQAFLASVDSWHNEPGDEINDATLPSFDDYATFDLAAADLPDGDGRTGWPRSVCAE